MVANFRGSRLTRGGLAAVSGDSWIMQCALRRSAAAAFGVSKATCAPDTSAPVCTHVCSPLHPLWPPQRLDRTTSKRQQDSQLKWFHKVSRWAGSYGRTPPNSVCNSGAHIPAQASAGAADPGRNAGDYARPHRAGRATPRVKNRPSCQRDACPTPVPRYKLKGGFSSMPSYLLRPRPSLAVRL